MNGKQQIEIVIKAVNKIEPELLLSEFSFSNRMENELLFFLKPECFLINDIDKAALLNMVFNKFKIYKVNVSGMLLLSGKRLEELSIMDRHYGIINRLSRDAKEILSDTELKEIQDNLQIANMKKYKILGGHEFLTEFHEFNENSLKSFWFTKKPLKLRSGFYYQKYAYNNIDIILINGFHPDQLKHFTNPAHRIVLLLLQSNTDWKILKNNLVGDTFPERAKKDSIRGDMYSNSQKYGFNTLSISNNCVHLSAGPFEALFEINNFLMNLNIIKYNLSMTNMFHLMFKNAITMENIKSSLLNPTAQINKKPVDLYTFTENKNSTAAVSDYQNCFIKN